MRYRLQRHDGTDCSATMVPITVLRMVPIQRYRHQSGIELFYEIHLNYILFFYFSSKNLFIKKTVPDKKGTHKKEKKSHFSLHEPSQNQ